MSVCATNRHRNPRLIALWLSCWMLAAAAGERGEYQVKAVFLYNFSQFMRWPELAFDGPQGPFFVCVQGPDPFGVLLDVTLEGQRVDDHPIRLRRIPAAGDPRGCHILYVAAPRVPDPAATRAPYRLSVSDVPGFAAAGGAVELRRQGDRIRLLLNLSALEQARVEAMANLLRLAEIVRPPEGDP